MEATATRFKNPLSNVNDVDFGTIRKEKMAMKKARLHEDTVSCATIQSK